MTAFSEDFLSGDNFEAFQLFSVVTLRQLRRSLQMKKYIANALCTL